MPRGKKNPVATAKNALATTVAEIKKQYSLDGQQAPIQTGIVDIITFCDDRRFLDLLGNNVTLWISQRVVLKCLYMRTRGNEALKLSKEEWDWLYENEHFNVIEKMKLREQGAGIRFSELTLVLGRRSSKTLMASIIATYESYKLLTINNGDPYGFYGIPHDHEIAVLNVATSQKQANRLFSEVKARIRNAPFFSGRVDATTAQDIRLFTDMDLKKKDENLGNIGVQGSVVIVCGHSNPDSLRGYATICIIFDELAFYDEGAKVSGKQFYGALSPSVADFAGFDDGLLVEISTPGPKTGVFYELWQNSLKIDGMLSFRSPTWKFNPNITYDNPTLVKARQLDQGMFDIEYGAEWPESGMYGVYFPEKLVDRAIDAGIAAGIGPEEGARYAGEYFAHIDPALSGNNYAMVVIHKEMFYDRSGVLSPRVSLAHVRIWSPQAEGGLDLNAIDTEVVETCRRFRVTMATYDQWPSGASLALLRRNGINTMQIPYNRGTKNRIYQNLKDLMSKEECSLLLYDEQQLVMELRALRYRPTPRGVSIGADVRGDTPTDDAADCLAGAAYMACGNYYGRLPAPVVVRTGMY